MNRRRFLTIAAAFTAAPLAKAAPRETITWHGQALGAEASITLEADDAAREVLAAVSEELQAIEAAFSLFKESELTRLNRDGFLKAPTPLFLELAAKADAFYRLTGGLFDPGIQPEWVALAEGRPKPSRSTRDSLLLSGDDLRLAEPGAGLTFNGIAQGFASDRIHDLLVRAGYEFVLVNIGEFRAGEGREWRVGLSDRQDHIHAISHLRGDALAVSSPFSLMIGGHGAPHILNPLEPDAPPKWLNVGVRAGDATTADAISTAIVNMPFADVKALLDDGVIRGAHLIDAAGDVTIVGEI